MSGGWLDILGSWLPHHHLDRDVLGGGGRNKGGQVEGSLVARVAWALARVATSGQQCAHSQVIEPWPERAIDHMSWLPGHQPPSLTPALLSWRRLVTATDRDPSRCIASCAI